MKNKISLSVLLLAIIIKFSWFYNVTSVKSNYLAVILITFLIYSGIVFMLSKRPVLALSFTLLITFILEGEVLYFRYFNKLLSFYNLTQVQFVNSVSNILFGLIRPVDLILLIDIIVLLVLLIRKEKLEIKLKKRYVSLGMAVVILPFVVLSSFGNAFAISVMNQEFFMYHAKDGIEVYQSTMHSEEVVYEAPEPIIEEEVPVDIKEHTGLFKGKNLITIQVESLQDMMLFKTYEGQEITPFMNELASKDSFYFSSYFQQLGKGNTSDAEFSSHNSLYPSMEGVSYMRYQDTDFKGLPVLLKERDYATLVFHGNEASFWFRENAYPKQGFDEFYSQEKLEMDEVIGMGLSDESLFRQGVEILKKIESPFYGFFVTITNHNPYELPDDKIGIQVSEKDKGTLFGNYVESVYYTDQVLKAFYDDLEAEGLLDDTVIIIYGDHHGIPCMDESYKNRLTEFLGYEYDLDEMMNIPMIIYSKDMGVHKIDDHVFDQQDLLPTLVNLYGIEDNLKMMGQDMLNTEDYFALFQTYMVKGSFIQNDIVFEMSRDGIYENSRAWHRKTKEPIDLDLCKRGHRRALYEIELSRYILENNQVLKD